MLRFALLVISCVIAAPALAQQPVQAKSAALIGIQALGKQAKATQFDLAGKPDEARKLRQEVIADYDAYLAQNPNDLSIITTRASIKEQAQPGSGKADFEYVVAVTSKDIADNPNNYGSIGQRAEAYEGLKLYENAKNDYNTAISLSSGDDKRRYATKLGIMELDAKGK